MKLGHLHSMVLSVKFSLNSQPFPLGFSYFESANSTKKKTRMHSSRIHTVSCTGRRWKGCLPCRGCLLPVHAGICLPRRCLSKGVSAWRCLSNGVSAKEGLPRRCLSRGCTPPHPEADTPSRTPPPWTE